MGWDMLSLLNIFKLENDGSLVWKGSAADLGTANVRNVLNFEVSHFPLGRKCDFDGSTTVLAFKQIGLIRN